MYMFTICEDLSNNQENRVYRFLFLGVDLHIHVPSITHSIVSYIKVYFLVY